MKMIKLCLLCLLGILTGTVRLAAQDVIPPQLTPAGHAAQSHAAPPARVCRVACCGRGGQLDAGLFPERGAGHAGERRSAGPFLRQAVSRH